MSDLSRTVEIIFQGTDSLSGSIDTIGKKIDGFASDIDDIGAPFAAAADKVALLTAAVAGIAVAGIKASSDIEAEARKMQNSLGLPTEEAERFKTIALDVYSAGYGDDLVASFDAVTAAQKKFGDNAEVDIGKVTEQALVLQKTFGTDYNEALGAVSTLMKNFGVDSEEAFNFLVTGFQNGLDGSGDFIESINEYSTQFKNGGADADDFFSVLKSGFSEGVLGTDKAADMFKEFRVRIQDDSKTTNEALQSLGIDPVEFGSKMASGQMTAVEAFNIIQGKLNETEDKSKQLNIGVALMGTQFEDLGTDAALAIDTSNTKLSEMAGAINDIDTKTFEEKFVSALRTVTTEFGNMFQWEDAKDKIAVVFGDIAASFGPALEGIDFGPLEAKAAELWDKISNVFASNDVDLTSVEGMQNAIQLVIDSVGTLTDVLSGMTDVFSTVFGALKDVADTVNDMPDGVKELAGQAIALGTALTGVAGVVAVGGSLMSGLSAMVGLVSTGGALMTGITGLVAVLSGPAGLAIALGTVAAAVAGFTMGDMEADHKANIDAIEKETKALQDFLDEVNSLPTGISTVEIYAAVEAGDLESAKAMLDEIKDSDDYKARVSVDADELSFDSIRGELDALTIDKEAPVEVIEVGDGSGDITKKIEDIPSEKILEIKLQGEIDTQIALIEMQGETAQAAFEWTAKVAIAEAQASADVLVAAFDSVGESVVSLSSGVSTMFGGLMDGWNDLSTLDQSKFMEILENQQDAQNAALESQIKLNDAQIALMNKKLEMMNNGDGLIKIDSTGLEPALEMVMWEIIEKVQIRASEESADFLLGISS